jgi:hypothetical protein
MPTGHSTKPVRSAANKQTGGLQPAPSASDPRTRNWRRRLEELVAFKKEYGHCCVSTLDKRHTGLGNWVRIQRSRRKQGQMSQDQINILNELGFSWDGQGERNRVRWETMYEALVAYQRAHGHCRVPSSSKDHARLADWIITQRCTRRKGKLSAERVRRLDELGFTWDDREERWEGMLAALVEYKKSHGNCDVPTGWPANPRLAAWVNTQRTCNRKRTLPSNRRKRLEALGFSFSRKGTVSESKKKSRQGSRTTLGPTGSGRPPAPVKSPSLSLIWRQIRQERSRRK